jgi:hypothetical protein
LCAVVCAGLSGLTGYAEVPIEVPPARPPALGPPRTNSPTPPPAATNLAPIELRLSLDLADGSCVIGVPTTKAIAIRASVGEMTLPFEQIASLACREDKEGVSVKLVNGDQITGTLNFSELRLKALFGEVVVPAKMIRKLTCTRTRAGVPVGSATKLAEGIQQKKLFRVTFDKLAEPIGSIRGGAVLYGFYSQGEEAWEVWSSQHPSRPGYHYCFGFPAGKDGRLDSAVRPGDNNLSLWGVTFSFDETGAVYHPLNAKRAVGRLDVGVEDIPARPLPPGIEL